ncbi:MAG: hypothetical protein ACW99G_00010 [Candidatus Thorarchaeota archaeon]|jgi:hypothetical protein
MTSRRRLIVIVAVGLLLLGATPRFVSADITGNVYDFSAVWFEQVYQVDSAHPFGFAPYYDEHNGTIAFQDSKVYFDLDTTDADANNLTEDYDLDMYPYFSTFSPGSMFFVNPVWSTHNTDWNTAVDDAEILPSVTSITESTGEGSFSFQIVMGIEQDHPDYNNMTGTATITFNAVYDTDGVLSTWSLQQLRSSSNENHTIVHTLRQSFARGAGAAALGDPSPAITLALVGGASVAGIIVGVVIGKKYWG